MRTVSEIILSLGGLRFVSNAIDAPVGTVSAWASRNSIPADYWMRLVHLARNLDKPLSYTELAETRARVAGLYVEEATL